MVVVLVRRKRRIVPGKYRITFVDCVLLELKYRTKASVKLMKRGKGVGSSFCLRLWTFWRPVYCVLKSVYFLQASWVFYIWLMQFCNTGTRKHIKLKISVVWGFSFLVLCHYGLQVIICTWTCAFHCISSCVCVLITASVHYVQIYFEIYTC